MREVSVSDKEIRIIGSKAVRLGETPPGVLSFVREWRPRQDLNL